MCKQPFTPPFSATGQPGAPLYLGTTYNLLANLVAQIRNAHPAPSFYGGDGMGATASWSKVHFHTTNANMLFWGERAGTLSKTLFYGESPPYLE